MAKTKTPTRTQQTAQPGYTKPAQNNSQTPAQPGYAPQQPPITPTGMNPQVRVRLVTQPNTHTRAVCSATLFGCVAVRGIHVIEGKRGLFVQMPQFRGQDGGYQDFVFPVTHDARNELHTSVLQAYSQALAQVQAQYQAQYQRQTAAPAEQGAAPLPEEDALEEPGDLPFQSQPGDSPGQAPAFEPAPSM